MTARLAGQLAFAAVLALGALLRLWGLGWLPSPAGDEGNWTLYGFRILRGEAAELDPHAAFVSLLYARLIAAGMWLLEPGFLAARSVNAAAGLLAVVFGYAVPAALGSRRCGLALAAVAALHPWAVLYSRISSVPYALAFAVTLVGPLLFVAGLRTRRAGLAAAGVLVVSLGAHFSPLAVSAALACGLYALGPAQRFVLRHGLTWAAVFVGALHVLPVARAALAAARLAPDLDPLEDWPWRLASYLHMAATGLAGEATIRHFTNLALPPGLALLTAVPVVAVVALSATSRARSASPLGGFGPLYLAVALAVTPLVLAPGREWDLSYTHMDRYLFAPLSAFALCVANVAALPGRGLAVGALAVWLALGCTGRIGWGLLLRDGVDHGEHVFEGGSGYRGWLVSAEPRATLLQLRDAVVAEAGPEQAVLVYADRSFIPLHFVMEGTGIPVYDVRLSWLPRNPSGRYYFVLWPDSVLALDDPPTAPEKYVDANQHLRDRMVGKFARVSLVMRLRQPRGAPLVELWRAEQGIPERLRPAGP